MTTLDETRWHYVSVDSAADLTGTLLELAVDEDGPWVPAEETAAPDAAAFLPVPHVGETRYWWRLMIGPDGGDLELTDPTTLLYGRYTLDGETLRPSWVIYAEPDVAEDLDCWPIIPCGDEWTAHTAEVQARAEHAAVTTLRALTGYRVGGCPVRLRPTRSGSCAGARDNYRAYTVLGSGNWPAGGVGLVCGCHSTGFRLPGEPSAVTEVKVDGVALVEDDDYRLLDGILYRTGGASWPTSNDLSLPDSEEGTWSVTYSPAVVPDTQAQYAAGLLACEWAKSFSGKGNCALPAGTKTVARAGVTFDIITGLFPDGKTGIREVDAFILRWNPHGLKTPSQGIDPSAFARTR